MSGYTILADKRHVLQFFDKYCDEDWFTMWMVDFSEDDARNMTKRIRDRIQLTDEKIKSDKVFFFIEREVTE